MGQNKEPKQIPSVQVVTERSHLPKNLESRLQEAWLSAVTPTALKSQAPPTVPSTAISSSEKPSREEEAKGNGYLKRQRSNKSLELVSSLENLFMRTKAGKRKSNLLMLDEGYPYLSDVQAGAVSPNSGLDYDKQIGSLHRYDGSSIPEKSTMEHDGDLLRLELEAGQFDSFAGVGPTSREAIEEEFYRGISGLQDAFDEMEFHLPTELDVPESLFRSNNNLSILQDAGEYEGNKGLELMDKLFHGSYLTDEDTSLLLSNDTDSSLEGVSQLEIEEMEASESLKKLHKECERKKSKSKEMAKQCSKEGSPVKILIDVARAIVAGDKETCRKLLARLSEVASVYGSMTQRVTAYFLRGLSEKLAREQPEIDQNEWKMEGRDSLPSRSNIEAEDGHASMTRPLMESVEVVMNASPFLTFGHVAANSAILEAFKDDSEIHIVDFGIGLGLQWPALIQAMAVRRGGPPRIHLTGVETEQNVQQALYCIKGIEEKLTNIARAWGVSFTFQFLNCPVESVTRDLIGCPTYRALVANCPLRLHQKFQTKLSCCDTVISTIRSLNPKLCTMVEQNTNRNSPYFLTRFYEALYYYLTVFDSLEQSVPTVATGTGKQVFEEEVLGKGIVDIVAGEGQDRGGNCGTTVDWRGKMVQLGFRRGSVSHSTVMTVTALLDTYRPGYGLLHGDGSLALTWDDKPLLLMTLWQPR